MAGLWQNKLNRIRTSVVIVALVCMGQFSVQAKESGSTEPTTEIHQRIVSTTITGEKSNRVALTLDACSGAYDDDLVQFLIRNKIPATLFITKKWIDSNPKGAQVLKNNLALFQLEDHGENHIPAVIGKGRKVYGIAGEPDLLHLRREVLEGARAIYNLSGTHAHWYRGATAIYDRQAALEIEKLGFKIAGFSVNADAGGTLSQNKINENMRHVKGGDVILAHMNKPKGYTAESFSITLLELLKRGLVFVKLDQVDLVTVK
jgi:peptidoglycan/xylan/chitin deacetylase (PgdA/CDA1 family)